MARNCLTVAVRQKSGDPAFVKKKHGGRVEARSPFAPVITVPGTQLQPSAVMSGSKKEDVSLLQRHALCSFARLELFAGYRLARFQPFEPAQTRNIQQHTSSYNAV